MNLSFANDWCGKGIFRLRATYFFLGEKVGKTPSGDRFGVNLGRASIYTPLTPEPPFTGDNPKDFRPNPSLLAVALTASTAPLPLTFLSLTESALFLP